MSSHSRCYKCTLETREPHFLKCDHFFCYRCVVTLYNEHVIEQKMQAQKQGPAHLPCGVPGCKTMTPVPLGGLRNLPRSCQLTGVMAALSLGSMEATSVTVKQYKGSKLRWRKTGQEEIRSLAVMGDGSCLLVSGAGVTKLPNGLVTYASTTLQRLSPQGKPVELPFPCFTTWPTAISVNQSSTSVVIVDGKGRDGWLVSVYNQHCGSWYCSSFTTQRNIQRTAVTDDGCVVCTALSGLQETLVLMSVTGQEEWTRSLPEGEYKTHICVSKDLIVVSSCNSDTVTVVSRQGDLLHTLPTEFIRKPIGVACDLAGRLIIADVTSKSISLFTPEGGFIQTLVKCKHYPLFISLSQDRFLLVNEYNKGKKSRDLCLYEL